MGNRTSTSARTAAIVFVLGLLAACGGGGGTSSAGDTPVGGDTGGTAPAKPLEVTATSVADGAGAVDPRASIIVTFNANLGASGVSSSQVLFTDGSTSYPVNATSTGMIMTVKPDSSLHTRTNYRLTIKAGVKGADGGVLQNDYVLNFRTQFGVYETQKLTQADPSVYDGSAPRIVVADVNADGRSDMVERAALYRPDLFDAHGYTLNIYLQNATGGFDKFQKLEIVGSYGYNNLLVLDTDGDGKPELLVAEYNAGDGTGDIRVFKAGSDGKFATNEFIATNYTEKLQALDVDGDGRIDLVGSNRQAIDQATGGFQVLLHTASGFMQLPPVSMANGNYEFGAGDLDRDGKRELIVNRWFAKPNNGQITNELLIYSQASAGVFSVNAALTSETTGFCSAVDYCRGMKVVDWAGDGKPALVFGGQTVYDPAKPTQNMALVFTRQASGGLIANAQIPLGNMASVFDVRDLDGDGVQDLLVVGADWSVGAPFFLVAGGRPDFSLDYSRPVVLTGVDTMYPQNVGVGDIDGDGIPDIVFDGYNSGIVLARYVKY